MIEATAVKFARMENSQLGPGATVEYRTPAGGETLAYIDYSEDGTRAAVTVFTPATSGERRYTERPAGRAFQIVMNHCHKQGYALPDVESIEDATPAAQLQHAGVMARAAEDPTPAVPEPAVIPAAEQLQLPACATREEAAAAYVPATTAPAPPSADESTGEWQQRVQAHFAAPVAADPQPEFRSVEEAADAILGEPADVVRHWISRGGTVYQLHLRAIVPAAETADALRAFVESDAHGYTRGADGRIWLWSGHAWNVGYAVVLPAE